MSNIGCEGVDNTHTKVFPDTHSCFILVLYFKQCVESILYSMFKLYLDYVVGKSNLVRIMLFQ